VLIDTGRRASSETTFMAQHNYSERSWGRRDAIHDAEKKRRGEKLREKEERIGKRARSKFIYIIAHISKGAISD
jgi:hypothetical protein